MKSIALALVVIAALAYAGLEAQRAKQAPQAAAAGSPGGAGHPTLPGGSWIHLLGAGWR